MIVSRLDELKRYAGLSPMLAEAIDWLQEHGCDDTQQPGEIAIGTSGVIVKCEKPALRPAEVARLEVHRKYIDIHVPLKGAETIGWTSVEDLKHEIQAYDPETDIALYGDTAAAIIRLHPGQAAIFFPEDAHAPNVGVGNHHKLCVKIPVI